MTTTMIQGARPWLAGLGATLLLMASPVVADMAPRVLHVFAANGARDMHSPPVHVGTTPPRLVGVSPLSDQLFGTYFSLDLSTEPATLSATLFEGAGAAALYTGLITRSDGGVVLGANSAFGTSPPFGGAPAIFQWRLGGAPVSAVTNPVDPSAAEPDGFDSSFKPRGLFAVDDADNVYFGGGGGLGGNGLFRLSPEGELVRLVNFENYAQGSGSSTIYQKGQYPVSLAVDNEANVLYGINVRDQSAASGDPAAVPPGDEAAGTLFRIDLDDIATDGSTPVTVLHTFAANAEGEIKGNDAGQHALVRVGGWLYGSTAKALWRYQPDNPDSFTLVHTLGVDVGDGTRPEGPLVLAADGNVYGTARRTVAEAGGVKGAGVLFRIVIGAEADHSDDQYQILHAFDVERDGAFPVGLSAGPVVDNAQTLYGATSRGGNLGNALETNDADGYGTLFAVDIALPVAADIQLSAAPDTLTLGASTTLAWTVSEANNCVGEGDWGGNKALQGEETLTPSTQGEFTYTLACVDGSGERAHASVTVTVEPASGGGSSGGGGGALSLWWLPALAVFGIRQRRRFAH